MLVQQVTKMGALAEIRPAEDIPEEDGCEADLQMLDRSLSRAYREENSQYKQVSLISA